MLRPITEVFLKMVKMDNHKTDKYYPKVVNAFDAILTEGDVVAPVEVFMRIGNLEKKET